MIVFRGDDQFPFSQRKTNGLYAHENTIKDGDGKETSLPIIYINATELELDPKGSSNKKPVAFVIRHEFGHYLGFKHSRSQSSLMSPAGYNSSWEVPGADDAAISAFAENL